MTNPTPTPTRPPQSPPVDHDDFMALGEQCVRLAESHKNACEAQLKISADVLFLKCFCLVLFAGMIALGTITTVLLHDRPAATAQESRP